LIKAHKALQVAIYDSTPLHKTYTKSFLPLRLWIEFKGIVHAVELEYRKLN